MKTKMCIPTISNHIILLIQISLRVLVSFSKISKNSDDIVTIFADSKSLQMVNGNNRTIAETVFLKLIQKNSTFWQFCDPNIFLSSLYVCSKKRLIDSM